MKGDFKYMNSDYSLWKVCCSEQHPNKAPGKAACSPALQGLRGHSIQTDLYILIINAFRNCLFVYFLKAGFEAPIRIQPSRLLFHLHFLLDQKVPDFKTSRSAL